MVDPNVLRAVGYNPDEVTGFAFGLGVERVFARRHGVADIRGFTATTCGFCISSEAIRLVPRKRSGTTHLGAGCLE